jgi:predicted nuclease with TOPRIM domain
MHLADPQRQHVVFLGLQQISNLSQKVINLKDRIVKEKNKNPSIEGDLIKNFPDEVDKLYKKFRNLDPEIAALAKKALHQLNFRQKMQLSHTRSLHSLQ